MINISEGPYFPQRDGECTWVRVWAEVQCLEYVSINMSGEAVDTVGEATPRIFLRAEDALHLAEELQDAVEGQERQQRQLRPAAVAEAS